jgi:acyl-coenzyme A thioesterase PaaI-like protein
VAEVQTTTYQIAGMQPISRACLVCGTENALGIKARFFETTTKELIALFTLGNQHQSYPGIAHGGISATVLDEVIGRAIMIDHDHQTFGMTLDLQVRYRQPVPLNVELKVVGRIDADKGRLFEGSGELYLPDGSIAVAAHGKYMKRRIDQITTADFTETSWVVPDEQPPATIVI